MNQRDSAECDKEVASGRDLCRMLGVRHCSRLFFRTTGGRKGEVRVDNIRDFLGIRKIKRVDEDILRWFSHIEGMGNDRIA